MTSWASMASESPRYSTFGATAGMRGEAAARWWVAVADPCGAAGEGGACSGPDDGSPHAPSSSAPVSHSPTIHGFRIRQLPPRQPKTAPQASTDRPNGEGTHVSSGLAQPVDSPAP